MESATPLKRRWFLPIGACLKYSAIVVDLRGSPFLAPGESGAYSHHTHTPVLGCQTVSRLSLSAMAQNKGRIEACVGSVLSDPHHSPSSAQRTQWPLAHPPLKEIGGR